MSDSPLRTASPTRAAKRAPFYWGLLLVAFLREPVSSALHLLGALAGALGTCYLLVYSDRTILTLTSVLLYGSGLVLVFLVSGLLHGLRCSDGMLNILERMDHALIYFFIAATYTPLCLLVIQSLFAYLLLAAMWLLAAYGIWNSFRLESPEASVFLYLLMGWSFLLILPSLLDALTTIPFNFLLLGGIFYTLGAAVFAFDWPHISNWLSAHDCWHLMALLGGASHYISILYIAH